MSFRTQRMIRALLNPLLLRIGSSSHYKIEKTLVVAGAPRSGTTWLAELLASEPRTALLFEPLNVKVVPEAKAIGLRSLNYFEATENWPEGEQFFQKVLRGEIYNWFTASNMRISRTISPRRWVVKFVRANLMLGWLTSHFSIPTPVLIVRHPCATIASRLARGWSTLAHPPCAEKFFLANPKFERLTRQLDDPIEYLAALWCIETYAPLSLPPPYPFHLMCYESLVQDGRRQLEILYNCWDLEIPENLMARLNHPSQTTNLNGGTFNRRDSLTKWREVLSESEVRRILSVVRAFGLDFYSNRVEPDYDRLRALRNGTARITACNP